MNSFSFFGLWYLASYQSLIKKWNQGFKSCFRIINYAKLLKYYYTDLHVYKNQTYIKTAVF